MITRLGLSLGVFAGSLLLGWWLDRRRWISPEQATASIQCTTKYLSPITLCLSFWHLAITNMQVLLLPLIGFLVAFATLLPAWGYGRWARLTPPQQGSFLVCAFFSNLGYLGAFIAFALAGERAYGLTMVHLLYFSPCFYLLGFTIAKRLGQPTTTLSAQAGMAGGLRLSPLLGLLAGLGLSLLHVPRPTIFESVNAVLIPLSTSLYLVAIGSSLSLRLPGRWLRACLMMSGIKFLYSPLVAWGLVELFRVHELPRFVVLLQAAMPMAISPLMLPALFGIDRRLTSSLLVVTTLLAIPWLLVYLPLIR